jgi:hypothetical protein
MLVGTALEMRKTTSMGLVSRVSPVQTALRKLYDILKARHKNYGLSAKLINRMLASQHLPPLVRSKIIEYREEKTAGLYGGTQHSEPDLPQANARTADRQRVERSHSDESQRLGP